jgi:acyl-CoA thioester hydrolase
MALPRSFDLRWSDADANGHVRHTVYPELAAEVRFGLLAEAGLEWRRLEEAGMGPVLQREEIDYLREVRLGERIEVDAEVVGLSRDGARWKIRHTFRRPGGEEVARVVVTGGWLDLARRKLTPPFEALATAFQGWPRARDFEELPEFRRR